jgi:chromosome segregation ATPase
MKGDCPMKRLILIVAAVAMGLGAAPASRPTSAPATAPANDTVAQARSAYEAAVARANLADAAMKKYRAEVTARVDASPAIVELTHRVAEAQKQLDQARASGTSQQKLDASAKFNRARGELNAARKAAIENDTALAVLSHDAVDAAAAIKPAEAALAAAKVQDDERRAAMREQQEASDPIVQAIRQHHLVLGMTPDQARQALSNGVMELAEESQGTQVYRWKFYRDSAGPPELTSVHWAEFRDGKLVNHGKN